MIIRRNKQLNESAKRPDTEIVDIIRQAILSSREYPYIFASELSDCIDSKFSHLEYAMCAIANKNLFDVYFTEDQGYFGDDDYLIMPHGYSIDTFINSIDPEYRPDPNDFEKV